MSDKPRILLVEDEQANVALLKEILSDIDCQVEAVDSGEEAVRVCFERPPDVILVDLVLPGIDGFETCRRLKRSLALKDIPVIFLTGSQNPEDLVQGLKIGAVDFVAKPFQMSELLARVQTQLRLKGLVDELKAERDSAKAMLHDAERQQCYALIGESPATKVLLEAMRKLAPNHLPVLLLEKPGSGAESVARAIHRQSTRHDRVFLTIEGGLVGTRYGMPLFGEDEGSPGALEIARHGTLFIRGLDKMSESQQQILSHSLHTSNRGIPRLIASASQELEARMLKGAFDEPLYEFFSRQSLTLPTLKQRLDDLPALVKHLLDEAYCLYGKKVEKITEGGLRLLRAYDWPGNLRELRNFLFYAVMSVEGSTISEADIPLQVPRTYGGYTLVKKLGEGGMGEVWEAKHKYLARPAVVKLIHDHVLGDPAEREYVIKRFEREARATAQLDSCNTIRLYDFGLSDSGTFYHVMEKLKGLNLLDLSVKYKPLPPARVVHFLKQACLSLQEAHALGFYHRDIKPENFYACRMGCEYDVLKLLDFGLVRSVKNDETRITGKDMVIGTPGYMAPELITGGDYDERADLYSLASTAYTLLTGVHAFNANTAMATITTQLHKPVEPIHTLTPLPVPEALEQLIFKTLSVEPDERVASALEFRMRLEDIELEDRWTQVEAEAWWRLNLPDLA